MPTRIGVVGCGLIGARRASVAIESGDEVVVVADIDEDRARLVAEVRGSDWTTDWESVAMDDRVDLVVVATTNAALAPIVIGTLEAGKHVLCEKPMGRNEVEASAMAAAADRAGRVLKVGFNHRHHPAVTRAHELSEAGEIGRAVAIRAAYGHGGRLGYEREWRADPERSGGGELLDQGVHVLDLCRWFMGEFDEAVAMLGTWAWPMAVEDNALALLRTTDGRVASIHTSWTQWKNLFRFEVLGDAGLLTVDGLGGSYGMERLTLARRRPGGGAPDVEMWDFPGPDRSWALEWDELRAAIIEGRRPLGDAADGLMAARMIDALYRSSRDGQLVRLGAQP